MPRTPKAKPEDLAHREAIVAACRWMNDIGLNQGTSGNISVRYGDTLLITPSGVPYDQMAPGDIAAMPLDRDHGSWSGPCDPSSEWRFHLDITRARPDVGAIVHTHSTFATVLSIARKDIPACHYMIAAAGGPTIRCGGYATYGTAALSDEALKALEGRACCLLANHGMIATGPTLEKAKWLAVELETIAKQYYHTLSIGGPVLLSDAEIERVLEKFKTYGPRPKSATDVEAGAATVATLKPKQARKASAKKKSA